MSSPESRVMRLFDLIKEGKSAEEIAGIMHDSGESGRQRMEKGRKNESQVALILSGLDEVIGISINRSQGSQDRKGRDLTVQLKPVPGHEVTYVQVKPSKGGIRNYRHRVNRDANIPAAGVNNWLIEHNQILINARSPVEVIKASFLSQLSVIRAFHRK